MYSCLTSSLKTFALFSTASQNNRNNSCGSLAQIYSSSPLKVSAGDTEMERARSRKPNHLWVPPLFWGLGMTKSNTMAKGNVTFCFRGSRQRTGVGFSCSHLTTRLYSAWTITSFLRNVLWYTSSLVTFFPFSWCNTYPLSG